MVTRVLDDVNCCCRGCCCFVITSTFKFILKVAWLAELSWRPHPITMSRLSSLCPVHKQGNMEVKSNQCISTFSQGRKRGGGALSQ